MRWSTLFRFVVVFLPVFLVSSWVAADEEDPPRAPATLYEDPLMSPGAITMSPCRSGLNTGEVVGEGFIFKVHGRCLDTNSTAGISGYIPNLTITDATVELDVKIVSGDDSARFELWVRDGGAGKDGYVIETRPAQGWARLRRFVNREYSTLAERADRATMFNSSTWNRVSLRANGTQLTASFNDQEALTANDDSIQAGSVALVLNRLGDLNSQSEAAAVVRNLRVSASSPSAETSAPVQP